MDEDNGQRRGATRERSPAVRQNFWSVGMIADGHDSPLLFIITEFASKSIFLNGDSLQNLPPYVSTSVKLQKFKL